MKRRLIINANNRQIRTSLSLWNETIAVRDTEALATGAGTYLLEHVTASDDTCALLTVGTRVADVDVDDMEHFLKSMLQERGLKPAFSKQGEHIFLKDIFPLSHHIARRFPYHNFGIIILINGVEPGNGAHAMHEISARKGDEVKILYRIQSPQ